MSSSLKIVLVLSLWAAIQCLPYDDGFYRPRKYKDYDNGRYNRSLDEGKYIPGNEGRYTHIHNGYIHVIIPLDNRDYSYKHVEGPNGGFGGNGGYGGNGGHGGIGDNGGTGDGWFGDNEGSGDNDDPTSPVDSDPLFKPKELDDIAKAIEQLVSEYIPNENNSFGENSEGSNNDYNKVYLDNEVALKCKYLEPSANNTEFITRYPTITKLHEGEKTGSFYSFKGSNVMNTDLNATRKIKLEYEVLVRVVDISL